ncbi:MAG: hypothetical protein AAGH15_12850 [Myxococcota bacterium]
MAVPFVAALLVAAPTGAQPGALVSARFEPPAPLRVGDRRMVVLEVRGVGADLPVLVTADEEGTAIEVVRGRLTRLDAEDPAAPALRFPVPLVARAAGTSVLRAELRTFVCDGPEPGARCDEVVREAALTLTVARAE